MRTLHRRFALIRRFVLGVLLVVPLFFAQGTQPRAAVINSDGTGVTSIDGLMVGAVTYDISFAFGTYDSLFGTDLFPFPESVLISFEINSLFNSLITTALISASGSVSPQERYFIPRVTGGTTVSGDGGSCLDDSFAPPVGCISTGGGDWRVAPIAFLNFSKVADLSWAIPLSVSNGDLPPLSDNGQVSPVPLPAALPLFGSALAMLGIVGWRRRRQADA